MTNSSPEFSCSAAEAVYLAALLGANTLVGFPDPFHGWLAEEVEPALTAARDGLVARGILVIDADGAGTVHQPTAWLIHGCTSARASLLLTMAAGGATRTLNCHLADGAAVVHEIAGDRHTLARVDDLDGVPERVLAWCAWDGLQFPAAAGGGALPEAALADATGLAAASGAAAAQAALAQAGLAAETAAAVARSLAEPSWNGSLVSITRSDPDWDVAGAAFLAGAGGMWQLRAVAEGAVELSPCTVEQAAEEVRRLVNRVLCAPIAG